MKSENRDPTPLNQTLEKHVFEQPHALTNGAVGELDATIRDVDAQRRRHRQASIPAP